MEDIIILEGSNILDNIKNDFEYELKKIDTKYSNYFENTTGLYNLNINKLNKIINNQKLIIDNLKNNNEYLRINNESLNDNRIFLEKNNKFLKNKNEEIEKKLIKNIRFEIVNILKKNQEKINETDDINEYDLNEYDLNSKILYLKEDINIIKRDKDNNLEYINTLYCNTVNTVNDMNSIKNKSNDINDKISNINDKNINNLQSTNNHIILNYLSKLYINNEDNIDSIEKLKCMINILNKQLDFYNKSGNHVDNYNRCNYKLEINMEEINNNIEAISTITSDIHSNMNICKNLYIGLEYKLI